MEHQEEEKVEKRRYCRFKYKVEDLKKAIEEVKAGKLSINKASQVYSIPKGTLVNKLKSDDPFLRKMGPPSVLSQEEENLLKDLILDKANLGFPMHEEDLKDAVQKVLNDSKRTTIFNNNRPGKKWVELFLKRHPEISKTNTEVISMARATVTESKLREWYDELTCYLHEENAKEVFRPSEQINAVNKEREKTEQFHSDENNLICPLPISKQGCSTTPIPGCSRGINEGDFPHKTTEDEPTKKNETVSSVCNSLLGESGSPRSDPWDKHLYWPKKEEGQTKKRKQEKVPYTMTSMKIRKGEGYKNEED